VEEREKKIHPLPVVAQVLTGLDSHGQWDLVTFELLGDAYQLSQRLSGRCGAWVLTDEISDIKKLEALTTHGCARVHKVIHPKFSGWSSEVIAHALAVTIPKTVQIIFVPGTSRGEEVAALLSEQLEILWIADVLKISTTRTGTIEITSVLSGGKLSRTHRISNPPVIVSLRPGVAEPIKCATPPTLELTVTKIDLSKVPVLTKVQQFLPADPKTIDITYANKIVAAGKGTGGAKGMKLAAELANRLKASPAASRLAVDLGWASSNRQVGQTGRTVKPDLYVACGISGASHHLAGMKESKNIIAINPDPDAPIHEVAHLSLYGDLHEVIPEIENVIERRQNQVETQ